MGEECTLNFRYYSFRNDESRKVQTGWNPIVVSVKTGRLDSAASQE